MYTDDKVIVLYMCTQSLAPKAIMNYLLCQDEINRAFNHHCIKWFVLVHDIFHVQVVIER